MNCKIKKIVGVLLLVIVMLPTIVQPAYAYPIEPEESIYGPYDSFLELYNAYMDAVEAEDQDLIDELLIIGHTSLQAEIERSKSQVIQPRYDAIAAEWAAMFPQYFSYGYFEQRNNIWTLSMAPHTQHYWTDEQKANGWLAVYGRFKNHIRWDNTEMMEKQFYCHARSFYPFLQDEWNLEPWRTEMDPFTCNDPLSWSS